MDATPEKLAAILLSIIGLFAMVAFVLVAVLDSHRLTDLRVSSFMRAQVGPFWFEEWGALFLILAITVLVGLSLGSMHEPRTPIGTYGAIVFLAMEFYILLCRLRAFLRRREVMNGGWRRGKDQA